MGATPQWITTPRLEVAQLTTANTSRDGTGTIVDLIQGADGGTRIIEVRAKATGAVADCLINLFFWNGSNWRFFDEFAIASRTPSATSAAGEGESIYKNLYCQPPLIKSGQALQLRPLLR